MARAWTRNTDIPHRLSFLHATFDPIHHQHQPQISSAKRNPVMNQQLRTVKIFGEMALELLPALQSQWMGSMSPLGMEPVQRHPVPSLLRSYTALEYAIT